MAISIALRELTAPYDYKPHPQALVDSQENCRRVVRLFPSFPPIFPIANVSVTDIMLHSPRSTAFQIGHSSALRLIVSIQEPARTQYHCCHECKTCRNRHSMLKILRLRNTSTVETEYGSDKIPECSERDTKKYECGTSIKPKNLRLDAAGMRLKATSWTF